MNAMEKTWAIPAESWGRAPKAKHDERWVWFASDEIPQDAANVSLLPYGMGRSYGDSCLNDGNILLRTTRANRYLNFDPVTGILRAECGVTIFEIVRDFLPRGCFLPTTPGTQFVTLGGAIANDVHGNNHHVAGTFGCHVVEFELLRSNGERVVCSLQRNQPLFCATIGGLGLTGFVTWAAIKLRRVVGPMLDQETIKYNGLTDFFSLSAESSGEFEHTVSWIDCLASGAALGRGIFIRGNHSTRELNDNKSIGGNLRLGLPLDLSVPFDFPPRV